MDSDSLNSSTSSILIHQHILLDIFQDEELLDFGIYFYSNKDILVVFHLLRSYIHTIVLRF